MPALVTAGLVALHLLMKPGAGHGSVARSIVLGAALCAFGAMYARRRWRRAITVSLALGLGSVLLALAVTARPNGNDIWYYQMYGRIVSTYHDSPYKHSPSEYQHDPFLHRTGGVFNGTRAEYGPVWIAAATTIAAVTGTNALAARLAWQGLAALAVFLSLLLVARSTRDGAAVALVALNPVILFAVVNAGHNDAFIGLALCAAVLLARAEHYVLAALACTVAALVKAPVGLALVGLLVWLAYRHGVHKAVRPAIVAAAVGVLAIAASGGRAMLEPMFKARLRTDRLTPWNLARLRGIETWQGHGYVQLGVPPKQLAAIAVAVTLVVAAVLILGALRDPDPAPVVALALASWLLIALYSLPWSLGWVMPVLALRRRALVTRVLPAVFGLQLLTAQWSAVTEFAIVWKTAHVHVYDHVLAVLIDCSMVAAVAAVIVLVLDAARRVSLRRAPADN